MERVFALSGLTVMPIWALMLLLPRWRVSRRLVQSPWVLVAPALLYAALVIPRLAHVLPLVMQPELGGIAALLGQADGATIAWVHFLAFDLFVGRWIYLDSTERNLSPWVVTPILFFTLMLGPVGLLSYLVLRAAIETKLLGRFRALVAQARAGSALLVRVSFAAGILLLICLALQLIDPRVMMGVSVWAKPAKFGASVLLSGLALAWMFAHMSPLSRGLRRAALVFSVALALELILITFQAARAVPSHFNFISTTNAWIFQAMGVTITVFWITQAWLSVKALRHRFVDKTLGWGIRLGLIVSTFGGGVGFVMTAGPTAAQQAALQAGQQTLIGAHTVGAADGGPGLPVSHWSTVAGDLRVPHFIGLHALQLLPLLAWGLARRFRKEGAQGSVKARRIVQVLGAGYGAVVAITLAQALCRTPLLSLHGVFVGTMFAVLALTGLGVWVVAGGVKPARPAIPTEDLLIRH